LLTLLADQGEGAQPSFRVRVEIAWAGLKERLRGSGLVGDSKPAAQRAWAGALLVLCAWTVFVFGGASFQKLSEHFQQAVPVGSRALPEITFDAVVAAALCGAFVVLAGALTAAPAFGLFLRSGGWPQIRRRVGWAAASTVLTAAALVALTPWAHSLTGSQRNGGIATYTAGFMAFVLLCAATLWLWTAVAVAAARRIEVSDRLLRVETTLALMLFALMIVICLMAAAWWGTVASASPWFLNGTAPGTHPSVVTANLVVALSLMVLGSAIAWWGAFRIGSNWRASRPA